MFLPESLKTGLDVLNAMWSIYKSPIREAKYM